MNKIQSAVLLLVVAIISGCISSFRSGGDVSTLVDRNLEIRDDNDLSELVSQFHALRMQPAAHQGRQRRALRARLIREYGRRIDESLSDQHRDQAYQALRGIGELWTPDELEQLEQVSDPNNALRREFTPVVSQIQRFRRQLSRAGADEKSIFALVVLALSRPAASADYYAEIDAILQYVDELSIAENGPGAVRARPIQIFERVIASLPSPYVLDQLAKLYRDRQQAIKRYIRRGRVNVALIRTHGESALHTTWNLVRIYALAEQLGEALPAISTIEGFGDNLRLRKTLRTLVRSPSPRAWHDMIVAFQAPSSGPSAPQAAFRIALAATRAQPKSASLLAIAGEIAKDLPGQQLTAIRLFQRSWQLRPARELIPALLQSYEKRIARLINADMPNAGLRVLSSFEKLYKKASKRWPSKQRRPDLASSYAVSGQGFANIGHLGIATKYLRKSASYRPTPLALEQLGTIALKQDKYRKALKYYHRALTLPQEQRTKHQSAQIHQLASQAAKLLDDYPAFEHHATNALTMWMQVFATEQHPDFRGEALVGMGTLYWALGQRDRSLATLARAVDTNPNGAITHTQVISFLVGHNNYSHALDTYHRALGNTLIRDYFKVFMSLWILAETRRKQIRPDTHALKYLQTRDGHLWHDRLAQYALGKISLSALKRLATRPNQRAELLYYQATLHDQNTPQQTRKLLQDVLATGAITTFEFDMAKRWLRGEPSLSTGKRRQR